MAGLDDSVYCSSNTFHNFTLSSSGYELLHTNEVFSLNVYDPVHTPPFKKKKEKKTLPSDKALRKRQRRNIIGRSCVRPRSYAYVAMASKKWLPRRHIKRARGRTTRAPNKKRKTNVRKREPPARHRYILWIEFAFCALPLAMPRSDVAGFSLVKFILTLWFTLTETRPSRLNRVCQRLRNRRAGGWRHVTSKVVRCVTHILVARRFSVRNKITWHERACAGVRRSICPLPNEFGRCEMHGRVRKVVVK